MTDLSGDNLLYPYLQKQLLEEDIWLYQMLVTRMIKTLGVWPHPRTVSALPVMYPHVIRDESARGRKAGTEQWGSPTPEGYLRDDNSKIKECGLKNIPFETKSPLFQSKRIGQGTGWVVAHIWQFRKDGTRASRHHLTNSFLPNLVWLPKDLAKLSDIKGSFVQSYLKALSHKIYGNIESSGYRGRIAKEAWKQLEVPDIPEQGLPDSSELNFFTHDPRWVLKKFDELSLVLESLKDVAKGLTPRSKLKPSRYRDNLAGLEHSKTLPLRRLLQKYTNTN